MPYSLCSMHQTPGMAIALSGFLLGAGVQAQTPPTLPLWEVGAFGTTLTQQAYPGSNQRIDRALVLPFFIYRGQYLRADQGNVGLLAIKTDTMEVDVGFSGAFGSNSNDIEARKGMPNLGTLVEFGPRIKWNLGSAPGNGRWRAELALRSVFDVTDGFRDKGFTLEPELIYERATQGGLRYGTSIGMVFGDQRLGDAFYGVAPAHASATRPAYTAQGGLIMTRLSLNMGQAVTPDLRLFGFARVTALDGAANNASPLVRQNSGFTLGFGLTYTLARSSAAASQ